MVYIRQKLWDIFGKTMGYIGQKLWHILIKNYGKYYGIYWSNTEKYCVKAMLYIGQKQ